MNDYEPIEEDKGRKFKERLEKKIKKKREPVNLTEEHRRHVLAMRRTPHAKKHKVAEGQKTL